MFSVACRIGTVYPSSLNRVLTAAASSGVHARISIISRLQHRGACRAGPPPPDGYRRPHLASSAQRYRSCSPYSAQLALHCEGSVTCAPTDRVPPTTLRRSGLAWRSCAMLALRCRRPPTRRFVPDSALEGAGFEPSVPGHSELCCGALPLVAARGEVDTVGQPDFFCSLSHSTEPGAYTGLVGCGLRRCSAAAACWR